MIKAGDKVKLVRVCPDRYDDEYESKYIKYHGQLGRLIRIADYEMEQPYVVVFEDGVELYCANVMKITNIELPDNLFEL